MSDSRDMIERICKKLLQDMEKRLSAEESIELKDYKSFTGALKELKELCRQEQGAADNVLTVRFAGEAEDCSV